MQKGTSSLLVSIFLDALGFSFIFPLIPFIVGYFGGDVVHTGYIVSMTAIGMALGWVFFWYLSDIFGRKNILLFTIFLNIVGYFLLAQAETLMMFLVARFVSWLWGGWVAVAQAYIWDTTAPKDRPTMMGYVGAVLGIWFTAWPVIGSLIHHLNIQEMGYLSMMILLLSFFNIFFLLPKNTQKQSDEHVHLEDVLGSKKILLFLFSLLFFVSLVMAGMQTILWWYLHQVFDFLEKSVALIFGYIGIVAIIYQGFVIRFVQKILDNKKILSLGLLLLSIGLLLLWIVGKSIIGLMVGLTLMVVGLSSVNAIVYTLIANSSKEQDYGKNMGIATLFTSMADIAWPIGASFLYVAYVGLPFFVLAWLILLSFLAVILKQWKIQ